MVQNKMLVERETEMKQMAEVTQEVSVVMNKLFEALRALPPEYLREPNIYRFRRRYYVGEKVEYGFVSPDGHYSWFTPDSMRSFDSLEAATVWAERLYGYALLATKENTAHHREG